MKCDSCSIENCNFRSVSRAIGRCLLNSLSRSKSKASVLRRIEELVAFMPGRRGDVIMLRLEGHSFGDIGRKLGITEATASMRYEEGIDQINTHIKKNRLIHRLKMNSQADKRRRAKKKGEKIAEKSNS